MVQSKGTRFESQRFRIDFTGKKKYSGFPAELRFVCAAGDFAARRAMPTSGSGAVARCGGGQSAEGLSRLPVHQPGEPWARAPASGFGSWASEQNGRKRTAGRRTGRLGRSRDERGRTGDIAHLERQDYFAFCSLCQAVFSFSSLLAESPAAASPTRSGSNAGTSCLRAALAEGHEEESGLARPVEHQTPSRFAFSVWLVSHGLNSMSGH